MNGIKAIETSYKGCRFRSRLEARWAVFFDALGVKWEYEKEGFNLGESGCYLPDFFIAEWNDLWVEIKPSNPDPADLIKPTALAAHKRVMLLVGEPWPELHQIHFLHRHFLLDPEDQEYSFYYTSFRECRRCDGVCCSVWDDSIGMHGHCQIGNHTCESHDKWPATPVSAYGPARAARFEHGELPRVLYDDR